MKSRLRSKVIALSACLIASIVLATAIFGLIERMLDKTENLHTDDLSGEYAENTSQGVIYYNSAKYMPAQDLETFLVIGIDKSADSSIGNAKSEQADFLALLVLDKAAESFQILHINRDTMTDIPLLDLAGVEYGTSYAQLALAHTYGSSEQTRCRNTVNAIQNLLYGIKIDHYISLTMDAVAIINDSVGGVTVQIPEDMTVVDPEFRENAVVTLTGKQALSFVRARGSLEDSSNLSRMERQRQYIGALFEACSNYESSNESMTEAIFKVNDHMASDLTINQLSTFSESLKAYTYGGIRSLQGEAVVGKEFMEYYADEAALQATVIEMFYEMCE